MDLCIGSIHCLISWTTEFLSNVCPENYCPKSQEPGLYLQKPYYHQLSRQSNHLAYAKLKRASSHNSSAWKIKGQIFSAEWVRENERERLECNKPLPFLPLQNSKHTYCWLSTYFFTSITFISIPRLRFPNDYANLKYIYEPHYCILALKINSLP